MLLAGADLKTIADQLGHSSSVLTADTYLSVAIELGHASRPPGGGSTGAVAHRRRSPSPDAHHSRIPSRPSSRS